MGDFEVLRAELSIVEYNMFIVQYNVIMGGASRGVGLSFSIPIILY